MTIKRMVVAAMALLLVAAACGGDDADDTGAADIAPQVGGGLPTADDLNATVLAGGGPAISVQDLLDSDQEGTFVVTGYVFVIDGDTVVMADLIAESFPPQPGGAQVPLEIDLQSIEFSSAEGNDDLAATMWTDSPILVIGTLIDGTFVGATAAAS